MPQQQEAHGRDRRWFEEKESYRNKGRSPSHPLQILGHAKREKIRGRRSRAVAPPQGVRCLHGDLPPCQLRAELAKRRQTVVSVEGGLRVEQTIPVVLG